MQRLLVDSSSAPALLLSGLPLDSEIPPTPMLPGDFRLPVAEAGASDRRKIDVSPCGRVTCVSGLAAGLSSLPWSAIRSIGARSFGVGSRLL